ncbi:hypothetical protein HALO59_50177 [Halomonas sp. 59]|nr:hypothetical protein HALO156_130907 [Halomonas sp. 156]CAD5265994.1 hypothetical protein HALOI3_190335 [Halomonas sp. I3]CAD5283768.1 hypothetical protein HALO113_80178 [Halomonas sp. 113]CAD5285203.1 hypothetical protein HALO59_50177 [Halomonas sp. 59]VXB25397.1 hypothetical protein HALO153_130003 [Halomonas titanicae]
MKDEVRDFLIFSPYEKLLSLFIEGSIVLLLRISIVLPFCLIVNHIRV